jgi:hypothetical protein
VNQATANGSLDTLNSFGCYASGNSFMIPPPHGTFGTMGRNIFRDTGFHNVDFSLAKNWRIGERLGAQFRAEFFNIFNHPNFNTPNANISNSNVGTVTAISGTPSYQARTMEFAVKFNF